jgi:MYXO-CTERM domain-containing protein
MNFVRKLAVSTALLASITSSQAAEVSFDLNGLIDSGALIGQTLSGSFSFDDATLTGTGTEWIDVSQLNVNFLGDTWTLTNQEAPTQAAYVDGTFLGLSYSASNTNVAFSFIPGVSAVSEAFVAYDTPLGLSGSGSLIISPVPEASTWAMTLAGLLLLGFIRRRN